jgi:hypothetical protein
MSVNPPEPTIYEQGDKAVATVRNLLLEYIGNCSPVTRRAEKLAVRSPLALGLLVVATLVNEVRSDDFEAVQVATMQGEVERDRVCKMLLDDLLNMVESGIGPQDITLAGPDADNNTLPYRQHVADSIARRDLLNVDWEQLARDFADDKTEWQGFTKEHDTRGCYPCLANCCMVGYEDALDDDEV